MFVMVPGTVSIWQMLTDIIIITKYPLAQIYSLCKISFSYIYKIYYGINECLTQDAVKSLSIFLSIPACI